MLPVLLLLSVLLDGLFAQAVCHLLRANSPGTGGPPSSADNNARRRWLLGLWTLSGMHCCRCQCYRCCWVDCLHVAAAHCSSTRNTWLLGLWAMTWPVTQLPKQLLFWGF